MRIEVIRALKRELSATVQSLPEGDFSDRLPSHFRLLSGDSRLKSLKRRISVAAGTLLSHKRRHAVDLGSLKPDHVTIGERFAEDLSRAKMLSLLSTRMPRSVLIPGCYMGGEDVQFWLRRGVPLVEGIDVYPLHGHWDTIVPALKRAYQAEVRFRHASIEQIPLEASSIDLVASSAVLEHVRNLDAMASETARILRPGGWAWHSFGPLYYSFGADHCIAAYGLKHGYDHLLLDEHAYRQRIDDQAFYATQPDPNQPFWAKHDQFSFATLDEYMQTFRKYFDVAHVVIKISDQGLQFRDQYPEQWKQLLDRGIAERDLLIKSAVLILRKN